MSLKINLCSGQRPFDKSWVNIDVQDRWTPDVVADGSDLHMFEDGTVEMIVIHHGVEHFGCGEANGMLKECHRILAKGGSLIITVPDMMELAKGLIRGKIDDQTYAIVLYGAYMGDEADRHKFGFTGRTLAKALSDVAGWSRIMSFDWREIAGASICKDWWILGIEAIK